MRRSATLAFATLALLLALTAPVIAVDPEHVEFFESKIRPVLVQHCYECHNSHGNNEGGLALDFKHALQAGGDSGQVIVPGKPDQSILIQALRHEEGYEMPSKAPKLDDKIIADFERWVRLGAPDPRLHKPTLEELNTKLPWEQVREQRQQWWSFQPLVKHNPPQVDDLAWSANPIDRFLFDRMRSQGLEPQPEASPEVLVRRLHLVLTGLPPLPEIVQAFVANPSPEAYEQLVDKLLANKSFGEHWARHWMDWYRYAQSHGSEGDPSIPYVTQYRDYLIRSLNADVPYDLMLREHLAGDLLKQPRVNQELGINESAIGPAHLRMVPHGFGVTDAYGEQIAFTDNQIDVISKAMLGVTVSCARCHDHKFDAISQKDYFRFFGLMVSSRPSTVLIDSPEKLDTNKQQILDIKSLLRTELAEHWLTQVDDLPAWLESQTAAIEMHKSQSHPLGTWNLLRDTRPDQYLSRIEGLMREVEALRESNQKRIAEAEYYIDLRDPKHADQWFTTGNSSADRVSPAGSYALLSEGDLVIRGIYPRGIYTHLISDKHAAVFSSANYQAVGKQALARVAGAESQLREPIRNYPLTHGGLHPTRNIKDESLNWQQGTNKRQYWEGEQVHFELRTSRDIIPGAGKSDRSWFGITEIFAGNQRPPEPEGAPLVLLVEDPISITNPDVLKQAYAGVLRRALIAWRDGSTTDAQADFLNAFMRAGFLDNRMDQLPTSLKQHLDRYRTLEREIPVPTRAPGIIDAQPVDHPLLIRGNYTQESEPVKRQFLEAFTNDDLDVDAGYSRLKLAQDMLSPANTLKTRVLINRLWAYVYGQGLAASTDNLGRLGSEPTHLELLDFLSLEFEDKGWSIKYALRQMVTSRAFRSSSQAPQATRDADAKNLYLSYFTPRRLDAEAIYDAIQRVGDGGERAVYLPVIRNRLDMFLTTFNAPVPTSTISSRLTTNLPEQSLTMMNGDLARGAAKRWAEQIQRDASLPNDTDKIVRMFWQAFSRPPTDQELSLMIEHLSATPGSTGGYFGLSHALLNSKEFIYVY